MCLEILRLVSQVTKGDSEEINSKSSKQNEVEIFADKDVADIISGENVCQHA